MRLLAALVVPLLLLTACGSQSARTVATVDGQRITTADVEQYETYALQFYSWVRADGAVSAQPHCDATATEGRCGALNRQVLGRLIQERVALKYARAHGIRLSASETHAVSLRIAPYMGGPRGTHSSLQRLGITADFLRGIVERQVLIGKVEDAVTSRQLAVTGPELRIVRYLISTGNGSSDSRKAARILALDGSPVPVGTQIQTGWVSGSDLNPSVRNVLEAAQPGQFSGPFAAPNGYLVYRLLDARTSGDPLASRQGLELHYFREWLQRAVRNAGPRCFAANGAGVPCPPVS